ncbi:hypothetical protein D3C87_1933170 [compost metagenome]
MKTRQSGRRFSCSVVGDDGLHWRRHDAECSALADSGGCRQSEGREALPFAYRWQEEGQRLANCAAGQNHEPMGYQESPGEPQQALDSARQY